MSYLPIIEIKLYQDYCQSRCRNIIEHKKEDKLDYNRGLYAGYLYGSKVCFQFLQKKIKISKVDLYNFIKEYKNKKYAQYHPSKEYKRGLLDSLYDQMNFIVT